MAALIVAWVLVIAVIAVGGQLTSGPTVVLGTLLFPYFFVRHCRTLSQVPGSLPALLLEQLYALPAAPVLFLTQVPGLVPEPYTALPLHDGFEDHDLEGSSHR